MKKKSHHYVPQFYLRNFSNNRKSVAMYLPKHQKYIKEASIKEQACKDYLYGKDQVLEDWFMGVEGKCSKIIDGIIKNRKIPEKRSDDYNMLVFFILLSEARTLKSAESHINFINIQKEVIEKMTGSSSTSEMVKKLEENIEIPNLHSIAAVEEMMPIVEDLKCVLLFNDSDREFVTSDNPLVKYNQMYVKKNYTLHGYGFGNVGIQLFFPISPRLCICLFDEELYNLEYNANSVFRISNGKQIDELNRLFFLNSYNHVYFNENTKEKYLSRTSHLCKNIFMEKKNEVSVMKSQEANEFLIAYSQNSVKEKINLSFFKINKPLSDIKLPIHMAGPTRKNVQKIMFLNHLIKA